MTASKIVPRGGTSFDGLDGEVPQARGTFFRLFRLEVSEVYKKVGISLSEVYKGVLKNFHLGV